MADVSRTLAQQMAQHFQDACSPCQDWHAFCGRPPRLTTKPQCCPLMGWSPSTTFPGGAMFSQLASHERLAALLPMRAAVLWPGLAPFAYLDDIHILSRPGRARVIFDRRTQACRSIWGRLGPGTPAVCCLPGAEGLGSAEDHSWVGDPARQAAAGCPRVASWQPLVHTGVLGREARGPRPLLLCGAPRANYLLRILPPCSKKAIAFAREHDMAVLRCLGHLLRVEGPLELDDLQRRRAQLLLARGRIGLRSAERGRSAAYWAPYP